MTRILIYGITGYTGQLIAQELYNRQWTHITIAGRDLDKTQEIAKKYNLNYLCFDINDQLTITQHISSFSVILNCAGPFIETLHPLVDVCIQYGIHYLDITGEIDVFLQLKKLNCKAKKNGCTLLPGVGFDVVPSDCLVKHIHNRLPEATHLDLFILGLGSPSRGTINTALLNLTKPVFTRNNGKITRNLNLIMKNVEHNQHQIPCIAMSWGDIITAHHSTKIPNITVYFQKTPTILRMIKLPKIIKRLMGSYWARKTIHAALRYQSGPNKNDLHRRKTHIIAHAWNKSHSMRVKVTTPNGYITTVEAALMCLELITHQSVPRGFQTPATIWPSLLEKLKYPISDL